MATTSTANAPARALRRYPQQLQALVSILAGTLLAGYLSRVFFVLAPDQVHDTHERFGYVYRLMDFREALLTGHLFPQWSTYMRGGLGEPYFSYYQPGFFYLAASLPQPWGAARTLGLAVFIASLVGFFGMSRLVGARFGPGPGYLAAMILLLSVYPATEIYIRGDFAEYTAMMLLPWLFHFLLAWDEHRRTRHLVGGSLSAAAVIVTHASVGLLSYLAIGGLLVIAIALVGNLWRLAVSALPLVAGVMLSAFYWFPVFFEWHLVQPEAAFAGFYDFRSHFVPVPRLWGAYERTAVVPLALGRPIIVLALFNLVLALARWNRSSRAERTLVVVCSVLLAEGIFMMTHWSLPLWEGFPPLHKVQFPWRLLSVVTVALATLASLWIPGGRVSGVLWRLGVPLLLLVSTSHPTFDRVMQFPLPARPADLVWLDYRVDVENEWVPRGARIFRPGEPLGVLGHHMDVENEAGTAPALGAAASLGVWASAPRCHTRGFSRGQSRLELTVDAQEDCDVVLPHYYFPVSWRGEVKGRDVRLFSHEGFLAAHLPAGTIGDMTVTFATTPMKKAGIAVSLLSMLVGVAWLGRSHTFASRWSRVRRS